MKLPQWLHTKLIWVAWKQIIGRDPDEIIDRDEAKGAYLHRWHVCKSRWFNIYVHHILRSDDSPHLHDHPWINASIVLDGTYTEHTIEQGGVNKRQRLKAGDCQIRMSGKHAHRLELYPTESAITLFITGPRYRQWGFHYPNGWYPFQQGR